MHDGTQRILAVINSFVGRDGEPGNPGETYTLKAMWLMMLSEFEASIKATVEKHIDEVRKRDTSDIHICLLVRAFFGNSQEELTMNRILSCYKRDSSEINYQNFTRDRVPKYKKAAVEKLFNCIGIFLSDDESSQLSVLDSMASTRDSIAHGDIGVAITRKELEGHLSDLGNILSMLQTRLNHTLIDAA